MPVINKNNISLGIGTLELGAYVNDVFSVYEDVGAIKSEVNIEITREVMDFESGRPLVVLLQEVIRERVVVTATLAELTVANMKMALGQGNLTSSVIPTFLDASSSVLPGTLDSTKTAVTEGTLLKFGGTPSLSFCGLRFIHQKADTKRHIFEGYRASPMGNLTLPFRETDWNLYQAQFRLLADTTKPAGEQYFQFFIED